MRIRQTCSSNLCVLVGRYSRAITAIEDLLTTWDSMSYVEKASPTEIARLVLGGEAIINDERLAWQRTGIRKDAGAEGEEQVLVRKDSADKNTDKDQDKHAKISILQE